MERELINRTTIKDCEVQTFRAGGKGGQNQNVRETGVRIIHRPSGAVGECREQRYQLQNKKVAFRRMAESQAYKSWVQRLVAEDIPPASSKVRIRTYHVVDRRVTDHRTGKRSSRIDEILDGDLDLIR